MKSIIYMFATLLLLGILAGCGQSGPLFVPGDPSSIETQPVTPESDEEKDQDNDDGEEPNRP
jgi:predicted small lipoprotein YifL